MENLLCPYVILSYLDRGTSIVRLLSIAGYNRVVCFDRLTHSVCITSSFFFSQLLWLSLSLYVSQNFKCMLPRGYPTPRSRLCRGGIPPSLMILSMGILYHVPSLYDAYVRSSKEPAGVLLYAAPYRSTDAGGLRCMFASIPFSN